MMKTLLFLAFVVVVAANPRTLRIQETAHEIAKSVKSSSDYSLEEKEEILANLKAINNDAKQYDSASTHQKAQLKKDLKEKLAQLKTEMHEESSVVSSKKQSFEEDEEEVQKKVENVHNDIKQVKKELQAAKLTSSQKARAKTVFRRLESEYSELAAATSKAERKEIARKMKATASELKEFLGDKDSVVESTSSSSHSLQAKKDKILSLVNSAEQEFNSKHIKGTYARQIKNAFEEMRTNLKSEKSAHQLKTILKSKLNTIKELEAEATSTKNNKDFEESAEEKDEKENENDFEEEPANADEE